MLFKFDRGRRERVRDLWRQFKYSDEIKLIGRYVLLGSVTLRQSSARPVKSRSEAVQPSISGFDSPRTRDADRRDSTRRGKNL